ncbi:MAG: hypothetical protein H0T51_12030 [Pirellulales bacterium]|nr:hypothetical protein [Pirellulales bacterium]
MHRFRAVYQGKAQFLGQGFAALALIGLSSAPLAGQTWSKAAVGYDMLQQRLGSSLPTGNGGVISQVEASNSAGAYYVDGSSPQFNGTFDPTSTPVTFTDGSFGAGNGVTGHATNTVGARYFGDTDSLAPGANEVVLYSAAHWLSDIIKYNGSATPEAQDYRVQNHSWVHTLAPVPPAPQPPPQPFIEHADNVKVLKRFDYLIETANGGTGMTAVVGLNNNANPLPYLLSHSYNAIAVGKTDGIHSSGLTLGPDATPPDNTYGPGRSKPDIVAPLPSTSAASAVVSSAATLLYDAVEGTDASNNEVIKSMLLAGATKNEFSSWNRSSTQPLDDAFGAGELNIYNSYLIQLGGQHEGTIGVPATAAPSYGWDYQDRKSDALVGDLLYKFEVPTGSTAQELSIVLAWNAEITDTDPNGGFSPSLSLQNLDLQFYDAGGALIDESISTVDNVEHLYFTNLTPGSYTLKVNNAAGWDFGLAWRTKTQFDQISADFNGDGSVDGADFLLWQLNLGKLAGASAGEGDADGDGDVDGDDLSAWRSGIIATTPALIVASAIPEPATGVLAAMVILTLLYRARAQCFSATRCEAVR